jgi:predicted acylesterase/phospholipase RssA
MKFSHFNRELQRKMEVSCVDSNTGNYVTFNENTFSDVIKAVVSSASIPFIFPHQVYTDDNVVCMDGGVGYNVNIVSAVERCRETSTDDEITVDIILCSGSHMPDWTEKENSIGNYLRSRELAKYYKSIRETWGFK